MIGVGIALLLTCIEGVLWIFNPFHLFGNNAPQNLPGLIDSFIRAPLLWLVLLLQLIVFCALVQLVDMPLELLRYIREVKKAQEHYRAIYTPITSWPTIYEGNLIRCQDAADISTPGQVQPMSMLELAQDLESSTTASQSHQFILGPAGAGKTMLLCFYRFSLLQRPRRLISGRHKIPLYIPLRNYSLYLESYDTGSSQGELVVETAYLFDFLRTSDLVGIDRLRPFLQKLIAQGRFLFLCDGLDEIDEKFRAGVAMELSDLMGQHQNQYVLTCREVDFQEQPRLLQMVTENLVARVYISPLDDNQVRSSVERFIEEQDAGKQWRHTAGQVMEVVDRSRLRDYCTRPLMLFALMEIIDGLGVMSGKQLDTRGRLLRAFVKHLVEQEMSQPRWNNTSLTEHDVVVFLSELACAARWTNKTDAIQIPVAGTKRMRIEDFASGLQRWLGEHPAQYLEALRHVTIPDSKDGNSQAPETMLHEQYSKEEFTTLLQFAQSSTLIEISPGGIVSFRHELIAAYFVAEYFIASGATEKSPSVTPGEERTIIRTPDAHWDVGAQFIVPIALWAGLLDVPEDYAGGFASAGQQPAGFNVEALTLALICVGVAYIPPQAEDAHQLALPSHLEAAVAGVIQNEQACNALALHLTRFAVEGAQDIYQSLFPLLMVNGIEELVIRLNPEIVLDLLFKHLCDVVDDAAYETTVKRLVRVLGHCGEVAVPYASELSQSSHGRSSRLRSAAINILGGTNEDGAVEPLIHCLFDSNQAIVGRAANALIRLGPEHSFTRLVQELEDRTPSSAREQVHWTVLHILERFVNEPNPASQLTPSQHLSLVTVLLHVLTSTYAPEDQQKAREMLVRQARAAGVSVAGERAVEFLVKNLSSDDDTKARATLKTLKEVGMPATPYLVEQLKQQTPEMTRVRIVEVLADVRDPGALPHLLRSLDDPALVVQQQIALALRNFAPESISGLIDCVLHGVSDLVATRAEQILGDIGESVTTPVIQALTPIVAGRTHLLVQVLERVHNPEAIPALIALLENPTQTPQVDPVLQVAVVHALGQFPDERVVAPLLEMLASSNPLIYEGAINALSYLEDVALDGLVAALDTGGVGEDQEGFLEDSSGAIVPTETAPQNVFASRIERAMLGMIHFPGERLLDVFSQGSDVQVQHVINIFLAKGAESSQVLVAHLFDPDRRLQNYVRYILGEMEGQVIVPALLEVLNHPEPSWRAVITELLLSHPSEAIPPLVGLLVDDDRGDSAEIILLEFGPQVLPYILPGLDTLNNRAQERARRVVVTLVLQNPELVHEVVQLFNLSPPPRAHTALLEVLTNELVDISIPALLEGLEDAHLIGATSEALVYLVKIDDARGETVISELLAALRMEERRHGAEITLVEIGERAVPGVGTLITDPDAMVARAAQNILCEMGVPAFSFIWAAHSDAGNRIRQAAARNIFRRMRTVIIKDELVRLLNSNNTDDISMALALLIERINDEILQSQDEHEMIPALLEHVQTNSDERASLRIMALLLLLGGDVVIDQIVEVLYNYPNHQQLLVNAFLLLGEEGEEMLLEILHDQDAQTLLRAESASLLGIIAPNVDIRESARMLAEYGLWAGQSAGMSSVLHVDRLAISLRALGGLLAGGHWDASELQNLRLYSKQQSAERELYDILLGWRYSPQIAMLEHDLQLEQDEHKNDIVKFSQEVLDLRLQVSDLEQQFQQLTHEHGTRGEELDQANRKIDELQRTLALTTQEKQSIQDNLQRVVQERQTLRNNLQDIRREKDALEVQLAQWRHYAEQLDQGVNRPQSLRKK
jgi:HEAT repeat protein